MILYYILILHQIIIENLMHSFSFLTFTFYYVILVSIEKKK